MKEYDTYYAFLALKWYKEEVITSTIGSCHGRLKEEKHKVYMAFGTFAKNITCWKDTVLPEERRNMHEEL